MDELWDCVFAVEMILGALYISGLFHALGIIKDNEP